MCLRLAQVATHGFASRCATRCFSRCHVAANTALRLSHSRFLRGTSSVASFIHFFRCCRRWGSSTTSRWKVSLGRVVLARLIEPPIVHARVELVDDSTCAVTFSRASKLACCRGRHADSNVHLEVGGDILSTCEAILKLSCMFR